MPKPFRGRVELLSPPIDQPELVTAIGLVCAEWAFFEAMLSFYYATLVFGELQTTAANLPVSELAVVDAFESLPTWHTKKTLMVTAAQRRLGNETSRELGKLIGGFESAQKRRNKVVHARWCTSVAEPNKWVRKRGIVTLELGELWDRDDFSTLQGDIREAMNELGRFFKDLEPRLKRDDAKTLGEYLAEGQDDDAPEF